MYILAIDDERLALDLLAEELSIVFPNDEIHRERKPSEALIWAQQLKEHGEKLDYAFMDIEMRGMTGLELAFGLKKIFPNVVLFFCTAYNQYAFDAFGLCAKGYLLKPIKASDIERVLNEMVTDWRKEENIRPKDIRVQTFGYFEFFVDGMPIKFERAKAKELLAFLVDNHGAAVTTEQIAMALWENEEYDRRIKNMATVIVTSLRNTLKKAGAEDILIKNWNQLAIDVSKIKCDAYDYEKWDAVAVNSFRGEYMKNYSWAEFTAARYTSIQQKNNG